MAITKMPFGRLGHMSTRVIFGGAALSSVSQHDADRALELLLSHGINHIDVAASYGDAELRIAPWLKEHRDHFFVATKTGQRTAKEATEELHRSLERMGIDHIDLWQFHNLADAVEWDTALSPGGAIDAAIEARRQGLIGGIGVTGHGLQIAATHRRSLERFDFDSVLAPYNYVIMQSDYYRENFDALAATCRERNAALQTIKSIARRPWAGAEHTHGTWYMPLDAQADLDAAVWWVLARPQLFLLTAGDLEILPKQLDAAERFDPGVAASELEQHLSSLDLESLFV